MSADLDPADVVVVGLGAAGGVAARHLAINGLRVVALEAGGDYSAGQFAPDQLRAQTRDVLTGGKSLDECPTERTNPDEVAARPRMRGLTMNGVGGTKIHSGNGHLRMPEWQFRARTALVERYGEAALPVGTTVADWPMSYDEVAPFYNELENLYGVSGDSQNHPFQARTQPYPNPPLRRSGYNDLMAKAADGLGWHPFATPCAIRSQPYRDMPACTYCGHCVFNGCWADAKGAPSVGVIPAAQLSGNLSVVTHARVVEVLTDASTGRATGVAYIKDGERLVLPATTVILASYTYENVRLLLLSRNAAHPNGLGNSAGQLGRHFTTHQFGFSFGTFRGHEMNTWTGTMSQAVSIEDFNGDNFDHSDVDFVSGGSMLAMMEKQVVLMSRMSPPSVPRWGAGYKRWLAKDFRSVAHVHFWVDELPHKASLLDLDPTHTDPLGLPVIRITRPPVPNDERSYEFMRLRAEQWLAAAGADETWSLPYHQFNVSPHAFGGARMSDDPAAGVTDRWQQVHDCPNVVVLGGATWPTGSGTNPTPTIEALAWRSAQHLLDTCG